MYPELLLITAAVLDPNSLPSAAQYLPGYDGKLHLAPLVWLLIRLMLALYLIASALAGFDRKRLSAMEIALRLTLAVLILFKPIELHVTALVIAVGWLVLHFVRNRTVKSIDAESI